MNVPAQNPITGTSAVKIAESVEAAIREGRYRPGDRLPAVRALAERLEVSPTTVSAAYRRLQVRGVVVAEGRRGTRVSPRPPVRFRPTTQLPADARDVSDGNPDPALLPRWKKALAGLDPEPLLYGEELNVPELLELARRRLRADGVPADSVAVLGGALDGIERVIRERLRPGDRVAVEDPGFYGLFDLLRGHGLHLVPMRLDDHGVLPAECERVLASGVQAMVITPSAQNPTGAALDETRVRELRSLLDAHPEVLLVEDDHAGPVAGVPSRSLVDSGRAHWAVVRSVAKSLGPDLRVSLLAGDRATVASVEGRQLLGCRWVSHLLQRIVVALWKDRTVTRLLERAARTYRERRETVLRALAEQGVEAHGRSGLNVWVPVPEESEILRSMLAAGWVVDGGERFRLESPPAVRLTVGSLDPVEAPRLAEDLARCLTPRRRTVRA